MTGKLIPRCRYTFAIALALGVFATLSACERVQSPVLDTVELSILDPDSPIQECAVEHSENCRYNFELELSSPLPEDLYVYYETRQQRPSDYFYNPNKVSAAIEADQHADLVKVIPSSGTMVRIEHGKKKALIAIEILPDNLAEPDEIFVVDLKLSSQDFDRVHFGKGAAVGTIVDDLDTPPVIQFARLTNKRVPDNIGRYNLKLFLVDPAQSNKITDTLDKAAIKASGYNIVLPVTMTVTNSAGTPVPANIFTPSVLLIAANALDPTKFQVPGPKEPLDVSGDPLAPEKRLWINLPIDFRDMNNPLGDDLTVTVSIDWGSSPIKGVGKPPDLAKLTTQFTLTKSEGTQAVNHTGVTHCLTTDGWYNAGDYCNNPTEIANFPGQDALIPHSTTLDDSNFELFSFNRDVLVTDPVTKVTSTIVVADQCVRDHTTGLLWEVKLFNTVPELKYRDMNTAYDWYEQESSIKGGDTRERNRLADATVCGLWDGTYCTTYDFIARMNKENFCGHADWRLPKLDELQSIVDYGKQTPANALVKRPMIAAPLKFGPTVTGYYWTAITTAENSARAWVVSFGEPKLYDTIEDGRIWRIEKTIPDLKRSRLIYTRLVTK